MSSPFWMAIAAIAIMAIIVRGVVQIVQVAKSQGSNQNAANDKVKQLEEDVADLENELQEMRKRIEVLETIVTDGKYDLGRQIDDLAAGS